MPTPDGGKSPSYDRDQLLTEVTRLTAVRRTLEQRLRDAQGKIRVLEEKNRSLLYLREHEPVTDLLRKEVVEEEVVQTMKHLDDEERARTCILYLDIDDFKSMNDTFGHNEGDLVLRGVADAVRAFIKPGDFAGRGDAGDEFIVFLRDASLDEANHVGELISAMVEQGQYLGLTHGGEKKRYRTSLSFGVAPYSPDFSFEEWKNAADADMYRRKRERKAAR